MEKKQSDGQQIVNVLKMLFPGVAFFYILLYLFVALSRMTYPFELEWMEGASVIHVKRILEAQALYSRPTIEFSPFFYPPLYFYLSAFFSMILGLGFLPLRMVSFLSSLGIFIIIYVWVKEETHDKGAGIIAAGLFSATFGLSGFWFDIARVDSLFLFFSLMAIYLIKLRTSPRSFILAGMFFSLSYLTKQTALIFAVPIMIYILTCKRSLIFFFLVTTLVGIGGTTLLLHILTRGWISYYLFYLPRNHEIIKENYIHFWTKDLLSSLFIACGITLFYVIHECLKKSRTNALFYLLLLMGFLGGAYLSRLHVGGWLNVLIPAYAAIAILFGLGVQILGDYLKNENRSFKKMILLILYIVCILQFPILMYNPLSQIPTKEDRKAGESLIQIMKNREGDIFAPYHSYLPELAGKKSYMHVHSLFDISHGDRSQVGQEFIENLTGAIKSRKFKAIFLDAPRITQNFDKYYRLEKKLFDKNDVFWPVTGMKTRPEFIFVPRTQVKE